ncbi:MAG TPA: hypothetical protein VFM05_13450, partial [Candidatus Saccharimonadales bacterium]|nr:hypothetical protein [Candidatus Saccharimonadales bacterium]
PTNFDMVELSPVTAFGSNSVLASVSQKTVLTTSRGTEVVADGVTALTLEAARRRHNSSPTSPIHLATLHRELRTQQHEQPGFTPHFHALSLISTERVSQPEDFKARTFSDHAKAYLDVIHGASTAGYSAGEVSVALSNTRVMELLIKNLQLDKGAIMRHTQTPGFDVFDAYNIPLPKMVTVEELESLAASLPEGFDFLRRPLLYMGATFNDLVRNVRQNYGEDVVYFDLSRHAGIGYYQDVCIKISATNDRGEQYPLVDAGSSDWLAKATGNRADRLITGGMGTELFMKKFRQKA